MKILLKIAYLGTNYAGFQAQRGSSCCTVQQTLTEAVCAAVGRPCSVTGCSRTDSGVHATGFCAAVHANDGADITVPVEKIPIAINHQLPNDISVVDAALIPDDFHPRYDVHSKEYIYTYAEGPTRNPFLHDRSMLLKDRLSDGAVYQMNLAAQSFIGRHDFSAFMAQGSKITDPTRTVYSASVTRDGGCIEFRVSADGFLYNMVRIMAGTLLAVGQGKLAAGSVKDIIASRDRKNAGITAPACGLCLHAVEYKKQVCWTLRPQIKGDGGVRDE